MGVADLLEHPGFRAWVKSPDAESEQEWTAFLTAYPGKRITVTTARFLLKSFGRPTTITVPSQADQDLDFDTIMLRTQTLNIGYRRSRNRRWWGIAASLALLVTSIALWNWSGSREVLYVTGPGEQQEITLADGTAIILNANSTLRLPNGELNGKERMVELVGEAFFSVNKHLDAGSLQPFFVQTDDLMISVLGTRFNVKERRGATKVFLEEGSVALDWSDEEVEDVLLVPGDVATYIAEQHNAELVHEAVAENHLSWTSGHLSFSHRPLHEVLTELQDIYGVTFSYATNELQNREMSSAGIPTNNLSLAVSLIERALALNIKPTTAKNYSVTE